MVARLNDSNWYVHEAAMSVREAAVKTLGMLEPTTLAQHAGAVVARLGDSNNGVRSAAVDTLRKLEPATLTKYIPNVIKKLRRVQPQWVHTSLKDASDLHPFFANLKMGAEGKSPDHVRARLRWMQLRALFRAQKLAQRWLAYIYEPGRPGFYRTLDEFGDFAKRQKLHEV